MVVCAWFAKQDINLIWAALYGGMMAIINALSLNHKVARASQVADNATKGLIILYLGAVQRFVITAVLFFVGMGILKLAPVPMIAAFAIAQFGILFNHHQVRVSE
jgi:ATP synthase protein I